MIRRPPRSTLFPYTTSSDLSNGDRARAFAGYMRIHTLEATGGLTYARMGRFVAKPGTPAKLTDGHRSEEHTSELQSRLHLVCRLLLEKKNERHLALTCK